MGFLTYKYQIAIAIIMGFAVGDFMMTMDITYFKNFVCNTVLSMPF
ncbi:MAG: hypothetical protein K2H28_02995 [Ruminococcus sp.]|nr:hypothetical protein [Ruminococcus sp.]